MNDQQLRIGGVAEAFGDSFDLCEIRQSSAEQHDEGECKFAKAHGRPPARKRESNTTDE